MNILLQEPQAKSLYPKEQEAEPDTVGPYSWARYGECLCSRPTAFPIRTISLT